MPVVGNNYEALSSEQTRLEERNSFSDLATTVNGIWAGVKRDEIENQTDVSGVEKIDFSTEALALKIKDEAPSIRRSLAGATSWADLERKRAWETEKQEANKNALDTYGVPGLIAAGITLGAVDYDAPLALASGGLYKGTVSGLKALKLKDRMSKVAAAGITGAGFSVANNMMYEHVTNTHIEDSNMEAMVLGLAFGGAIGTFATRVPQTRKVFTDNADVKVELSKAEKAATEMTDLKEAQDILHKEHAEAKGSSDKLQGVVTELKVKARAAREKIWELKKDNAFKIKAAVERTEFRDRLAKINEEVPYLKEQHALLKDELDVALEYKLDKASIKKIQDNITKNEQDRIALTAEADNITATIKKLSGKATGYPGRQQRVDHPIDTKRADELQGEIDKLQKELDTDTASIKEHEAALKGDFKPKAERLRKLKVKNQSTINALQEEISKSQASIDALSRSMEADAAGMDFGWMNHMFISPKMRNFASKNPAVQGLTSLLESSSIVGMGKNGEYVKNTRNAATIKDEISGKLNQAFTNKDRTGVVDTYFTAVEKGEFDGTYHEWEAKVSQNSYRKIGEAIEEQTGAIVRNQEGVDYAKLREEALGKVTIKYDGSELDKASKTILDDYFGYISKRARAAKMDKFGDIHGLYMPHIWKGGAMEAPDAVHRLVQAQIRYAEHFGLPVDIDKFTLSANAAVESSRDGYQHIIHQMKDPMSPTTDKSSRLKSRSIQVFDHDVADLLATDLEQIMKGYDMSMSGKLALQETIGLTKVDDIMNQVVHKVTSDKGELERFRAILNTITGIQEISSKRGTLAHNVMQTLTKTTSLVFMPGFALPALTEITNAVGLTGYNKIMSEQFSSIKSAADLIRNKSLSVKAHNDLVGVANIGNSRWGFHANRMDGDAALNSTTKLHNILDSANHKASKIFGLQPVTEASRILAGSSGVNWLLDVAQNPAKLSAMDDKRLARLGLDRKDLQDIADARQHVEYDADGRLVDWHMENWKPEVHAKMRDAIYQHINSSILHPDGASLPMWITDPDSWIAKVTMQFMRFPMDSYEKLALRGVSEFDGKQMSGLVGNLAVWYMVTSFRDAIKVEDKQRYNGKDGNMTQFQDVISMSSMAGGPISMVSKAYTMGTGNIPGSDYSPGASSTLTGAPGSVINKITEGKIPGLFGVVQDRIMEAKLIGDYSGE